MTLTFRFIKRDHIRGDISCLTCQTGMCVQGYPIRCECGGLIHCEVVTNAESDYGSHTACDNCGEVGYAKAANHSHRL